MGRVLAFLSDHGIPRRDVFVRSDQEAAIEHTVEEVEKRRAASGGGKWLAQHSPGGSSASSGVVEQAIQSVQGHTRVAKVALEKRLGVEASVENPLADWMVEYSAYHLSRCKVGHDGKTAD